MKEYKYYYVYRITNIILKKHYYGYRSSNIHPTQDLGINYFSSSLDKDFIFDQKNKPNNYKYVIVRIFDNRIDAHNLEIYLHERFNVGKNHKFYNRCKATTSNFSITGTSLSKETKRKMSISRSGKKHSIETKIKLSESKLGNLNPAKDIDVRNKMSKSKIGNTNASGKRSKESCKRIGDAKKGQIPWNKDKEMSDKSKKKMSLAKINMTDEQKINWHSWKKGRPLSENVKEKLRKPQKKIKCPHCNKIGGISAMKRHHFDKCKHKNQR